MSPRVVEGDGGAGGRGSSNRWWWWSKGKMVHHHHHQHHGQLWSHSSGLVYVVVVVVVVANQTDKKKSLGKVSCLNSISRINSPNKSKNTNDNNNNLRSKRLEFREDDVQQHTWSMARESERADDKCERLLCALFSRPRPQWWMCINLQVIKTTPLSERRTRK